MEMKEEMTLTTGVRVADGTATASVMVAKAARRVLSPLAKYYSGVLGVELGIRQTLKLLNAQAWRYARPALRGSWRRWADVAVWG